jgi:hypothetical protein
MLAVQIARSRRPLYRPNRSGLAPFPSRVKDAFREGRGGLLPARRVVASSVHKVISLLDYL